MAAPTDVDLLLAPGGALSVEDPGFEDRPGQRAMARAVSEALEGGGCLVAEAGTGVGKSLAYLLPGALWALRHGRRLLVSTHTRALQEQIVDKDLPLAAAALTRLGLTLRFAMLQGAENYLCVQRLDRLARDAPDLFDGAPALIDRLARWARTSETGHRSKIPELVPQALWSRLCRDPDLCLGPNGRLWSSCLYRKDKERAERAHVLVVNHALLLSGARLPSYDALVVDEAHTLEDAAASHFGLAVSKSRLTRLLEDARPLSRRHPELLSALKRCGEDGARFFDAAARAHGLETGRREESSSRLLEPSLLPEEPAALRELEALCLRLMETRAAGPEPSAGEEEAAWAADLRLLHLRVAGFRGELSSIVNGVDEETARWIEAGAGVELKASPLEVGARLAETVFSRGIPTILTSATLSGGGTLKEFRRRLGLEDARELAVASPFDYRAQAGLLMLGDVPDPSDDRRYATAVAARCLRIVRAVPGGVFILFSSWRSLRAVHARLRRRIKDRPLWVQGEAGNDVLLEQFSRAGNAVLLGVDTFWQGIDVPGEALSCVVLTKLPFPNFASPVEESRRRWFQSLGRDYFRDHSLPRAVMKFRQGFGRLIRTATDRGAVVVLDSRILKRGYGAAFREALPPCRQLADLEALGEFFQVGRRA